MKLFSNDHSGFYVSNHRCSQTEALLHGLQQSLLLENSNREFAVLVPSVCKPTRPEMPGTRSPPVNWLASPTRFSLAVILVLAGIAGAGRKALPASTRISARMKHVQGHSSPVNVESRGGRRRTQARGRGRELERRTWAT